MKKKKEQAGRLLIDTNYQVREIHAKLQCIKSQIDNAFGEIVGAVDDYMDNAPLTFIQGAEGAPGEYIFPDGEGYDPKHLNKFYGWIERWMGMLFPETIELQKTIIAGNANDDTYMELCYRVNEFGFIIGYLVGCRSMGAGHDELIRKSKPFTAEHLRMWKRRLEAAQKKEQSRND